MICFLFLLAAITPPGEADAMDALAAGELYLQTFGRMAEGVHRDDSTGILLSSMGCVMDHERMQYISDWNDFIIHTWEYLGSDSTFFFIRSGEETLEYGNSTLIYRDQWGSAQTEIYPEELAGIAQLVRNNVDQDTDSYGYLEMYSPLWEDTVSLALPADRGVIENILIRGREAARVNRPL